MAIEKLPSTGDAPRSTGVPASLVAGGAADSAGFPWAGRTFDHHETAFAEDDGLAPPALRDAVTKLRVAAAELQAHSQQGSATVDALRRLAEAHAAAFQELSKSRLLIPLLAEAGDIGLTPEGRTVEKTQELSIVTVGAPDGRRVMPVFTSVDTMRNWNSEARPIPVPAPQVALAAATELTDLIIVDPATPEWELGVRRTQLEPVALAQEVSVPWADSAVISAFRASLADQPIILGLDLIPGDPEARLLAPETTVQLTIKPGLDRDELSAVLAVAQERWAANELIADRVDSLRVVLKQPE